MSHISSPRTSEEGSHHSDRSASQASAKSGDKHSDQSHSKSRSRSGSAGSISLVDVDEDAHPFREDRKLTEILDRLGETAAVRKVIHEQEIDTESLRLLTVETLSAAGIPKLSALRILDEVAKLKEAQNLPHQIEERMDNVHMSTADAEDTDALIREITGKDAKVQQEALDDVRTLAAKDHVHRRALTKVILDLVAGGRHPALDTSQRYAVSVLVR